MKKLVGVILCMIFLITSIYGVNYRKELKNGNDLFTVIISGDVDLGNGYLEVKAYRNGNQTAHNTRWGVSDMAVDAFVLKSKEKKDVQIIIFTSSDGSGSYGNVFAYNYNGKKLQVIEIEKLNDKYLEGYMGHDVFKIEKNRLVRSFPLYNKEDPNCCPTGGRKMIVYKLKKTGNNLTFAPEKTVITEPKKEKLKLVLPK